MKRRVYVVYDVVMNVGVSPLLESREAAIDFIQNCGCVGDLEIKEIWV